MTTNSGVGAGADHKNNNNISKSITSVLFGHTALDVCMIRWSSELWTQKLVLLHKLSEFDRLQEYIENDHNHSNNNNSDRDSDKSNDVSNEQRKLYLSLLFDVDNKKYWQVLTTIGSAFMFKSRYTIMPDSVSMSALAHEGISRKLIACIVFLFAFCQLSAVVGFMLFIKSLIT